MPRNTLNGTCTTFCDSGISTDFSTMSPGVSCGAGEGAAEHHRVAAEEQRLRDAAVAPDAAVGDERHALADGQPRLHERLDLRHAEVRRQPRRAAAAGTDADLDAVDAALEQEPRALGGRDVAGDQLDVAESLARICSIARSMTSECPCAMSMTSTSAPARSTSAARSR